MDNRTERLAEGVWRVEVRWGINVYVVAGTDGLTLVDTGTENSAPTLVRSIRLIGLDPQTVNTVVLTHWHADHMGAAARFVASSAAPRVQVGRGDLPAVVGRQHRPQADATPQDASLAARLAGRFLAPGPAVADATGLEDGERLDGIDAVVIDSPGHTAGHICLHLPRHGLLLAGDAVFNILRLTRGPGLTRSARSAEAATLERLAALEFDVLAMGHGPPVVTGARQRLARLASRVA